MFFPTAVYFAAFAVAAKAVSTGQIKDTLGAFNTRTTALTNVFNAINGGQLELIDESKEKLEELAFSYKMFSQDLLLPSDVLGSLAGLAEANEVARLAKINAETYTQLGISLVKALPTYEQYALKDAGCKDGVDIGVFAIVSYTQLAVRFPTVSATLLSSSVLGVVNVPLTELSVVEDCFVPPGFIFV